MTFEPWPKPEDPERELFRLIRYVDELRELYRALGYHAWFYKDAQELAVELDSLVRVDIPDYEGFVQVLTETLQKLDAPRRGRVDPHIAGADRQFIMTLLSAGDDRQTVVELINARRKDEKNLGLHIESSVLKKRPVNEQRFVDILDTLERMARPQPSATDSAAREKVLEEVLDVRKCFARGDNITSPASLYWRVDRGWCRCTPSSRSHLTSSDPLRRR